MAEQEYTQEALLELLKKEREVNKALSDELNLSNQSWSGQWELNLMDKSVTWSDGIYHILGLDVSTKADMNHFRSALPAHCLDRLNGALNKVFVTKTDYDFEHYLQVNNDVKSVRTQLKPVIDPNGKIYKIIGKLSDISSAKSSQKELEKLSLIASNTSNGVVFLNLDAEVEWSNSAFTVLTGFRKEESERKLFDEFLNKPDGMACCKDLFEQEFKKITTVSTEVKFKTKKGHELWVVLTINAILDYALNPESYIVIITDITDRKLAEELLAVQNRDITASINYAKRIQQAIIPTKEFINRFFPSSFILYLPRDIVAGDFYWMEEIDDKVLFAVADCTGHGVPGAMVSVVCHNALNRAVKEFNLSVPGEILDKVTELVLETFAKGNDTINDGMDIALISYSKTSGEFQYSGANNGVYLVNNKSKEIDYIKADRQPVGKFDKYKPFTTHTIKPNKGDTLYMYSDGYADQFGGPESEFGGKKFMKKRLRELILKVTNEPINAQHDILLKELKQWQGSCVQTDDVLLVGIQF